MADSKWVVQSPGVTDHYLSGFDLTSGAPTFVPLGAPTFVPLRRHGEHAEVVRPKIYEDYKVAFEAARNAAEWLAKDTGAEDVVVKIRHAEAFGTKVFDCPVNHRYSSKEKTKLEESNVVDWERFFGKKDEPKKDEPKKDEPKKDEPKKDEPKKDDSRYLYGKDFPGFKEALAFVLSGKGRNAAFSDRQIKVVEELIHSIASTLAYKYAAVKVDVGLKLAGILRKELGDRKAAWLLKDVFRDWEVNNLKQVKRDQVDLLLKEVKTPFSEDVHRHNTTVAIDVLNSAVLERVLEELPGFDEYHLAKMEKTLSPDEIRRVIEEMFGRR